MNLWLTRLVPNTRDREAQSDLVDIQRLHQRIMTLFPDALGDTPRRETGALFRLEHRGSAPTLLLQSGLRPDPANLPSGYTMRPMESHSLSPLLEALGSGSTVRYRIVGNPTMRLPRGHDGARGRPGQLIRLIGAEAEDWWMRRAPSAGLEIDSMQAVPQPDVRGKRAGAKLCHAATRFDGAARVTDADALRNAIAEGIGRGKSYGCGLLSVALLNR